MSKEDIGIFGEEQGTMVTDKLRRYIRNWPLFLVCIGCCVSAGILYSRYTVPKYIATTSLLIKGSESGKGNSQDLIESALNGKREVNLNNEMLLIRSSSLMYRTVAKNDFNISYYRTGGILNVDIYKDAPFRLVPTKLTDSNSTYQMFVKNIDIDGGSLIYGTEKNQIFSVFRWNQPFQVNGQVFLLSPAGKVRKDDQHYLVQWQPIHAAAERLSSAFTVKAFDSKTSVIELSVKTENLQKGKDLLNALLKEFNLSDLQDRNRLSENTVQFIDDRLFAISAELKGVEGNLENYQGSNQLIDIKGQSAQSLENSNDVSKTIKDIAIQKSVAEMILHYFSNPANGNKLVPSSLGLNDATLASLIVQYNELQLKKEREAPINAPKSILMQDLHTQTSNLKSSILESLNNITKNLHLQETSFKRQNNQYRSFLTSLPHNERVMQEIKRKQSITEGLYLYLLQKREEAAISGTASNVIPYKQIDPAAGFGPIEPNTKKIIAYTFLLGFFIAFGWIYLNTLFNDKHRLPAPQAGRQ